MDPESSLQPDPAAKAGAPEAMRFLRGSTPEQARTRRPAITIPTGSCTAAGPSNLASAGLFRALAPARLGPAVLGSGPAGQVVQTYSFNSRIQRRFNQEIKDALIQTAS